MNSLRADSAMARLAALEGDRGLLAEAAFAARHAICVASYGPCTPVVAGREWLAPKGKAHDDPDRLAVFRSG